MDVYRNIIFKKLPDNVIFFTAFFSVIILELTTILAAKFETSPIVPYFCAIFGIPFAIKLISNRIQNLRKI